MRKHRILVYLMLAVIFTTFILSLIGASSWLIVTWKDKSIDVMKEQEFVGITQISPEALPPEYTTESFTNEQMEFDESRTDIKINLTETGKIVYGLESDEEIQEAFKIRLYAYRLAGDDMVTVVTDEKSARDIKPLDAGEYYYEIVHVPTGQIVSSNHTVRIAKKAIEKPTFSLSGDYTYVYTGSPQGILVEGFDAGVMKYAADSVTSATNKGDYTAKVELLDPKNYEWKEAEGTPNHTDAITYPWAIKKGKANIVVNTTDIVKDYGEEFALPEATTNFGTVKVDKTINDVKSVGEHIVTYSVAGTENYDGDTKTVKITIKQSKFPKPSIIGSYTYVDALQSAQFENFDPNTMTATGTLTAKDAGTYEVTFSLKNKTTHKWDDGTEEGTTDDFTLTWTIAKAKVNKPTFSLLTDDYTYIYTGSPQGILVTGFDESVMKYADGNVTSATSAGNYAAKVALKDSKNYEWKDTPANHSNDLTYDWSIGMAQATITVDTTPINKDYGEVFTLPTATTNFGTVTVDKTINDVKSVGTHTVTYTVEGTSDYHGDTKTLTVNISTKLLDKPTIKGSYTYDGTDQTVQFNNFDPSTMTSTGTLTATDAGTIEITISLKNKDGYAWEDNTTDDFTLSWTIAKAKVDKPTPPTETTFEYNGVEKEIVFSDFDSSTMTISGNKATDAGSYTAIVKPGANYQWSDGTTTDITCNWTITKVKVTKPTLTSGTEFTYNGTLTGGGATTWGVTFSEFDESVIQKTGTHSAANAGNYAASFKLINSNYEWIDEKGNHSNELDFNWSIAKKVYTVAESAEKRTVFAYKGDSVTVNVKYNNETVGGYTYKIAANTLKAQYGKPSTVAVDKTLSLDFTTIISGFSSNNCAIDIGGDGTIDEKLNISYTLLGTTKVGSIYYSDINTALAVTSGTVIPLQSFTHSYKSTDANGNEVTKTDTYSVTGIGDYRIEHIITANATVNSGVTLEIPTVDITSSEYSAYAGGKVLTQSTNTNGREDAAYTKNIVKVADGVTLTNNGTITVSAVVSGGAAQKMYNAVASDIHAKIILGANAKLHNATASSVINCYGFIDEETENNGSQIWVEKGTFLSLFTVVEHRGGSTFLGMTGVDGDTLSNHISVVKPVNISKDPYNAEVDCFPFNRFFVQAATSTLRIEAEAQLNGYVDLYADEVHNETTIKLLGKDSSSIVQLNNKAVAEAKFHYNSSNPVTSYVDLDIYGDAKINPLVLSLAIEKEKSAVGITAVGRIEVNMSTRAALFPISYNWDISFNKYESGKAASVDATGQGMKVLPGGKLTIGEGVTMEAKSIAVYDYESTTLILDPTGTTNHVDYNVIVDKNYKPKVSTYDSKTKYYTTICNTKDAYFYVGGELKVVNLGGVITPISSSAKVTVSGSCEVNSPEVIDVEKKTLTVTVYIVDMDVDCLAGIFSTDTKYPVSDTEVDQSFRDASKMLANGLTMNGASGMESVDFVTNKAYTTLRIDGTYYWAYQIDPITITYNSKGGSAVSNAIIATPYSNGVTLVNGGTYLPIPSRAYYNFAGWYLDEGLTREASGATIYENTTLYAKWTPKDYTLNFDYAYEFSADELPTAPDSITFNADTVISLEVAPFGTYKFAGWSSDAGHENKITGTSITGLELLKKYNITDTTTEITLYGLWAGAVYTVKYYKPDGSLFATVEYSESALQNKLLSDFSDACFEGYGITDSTWYNYWTYGEVRVYKPADFIDKESGVTEYELYPGESNKYILNIDMGDRNFANASAISDITGIYVSDVQLGNILASDELDLAKKVVVDDTETNVPKRFGCFKYGAIELSVNDALASDMFVDGVLTLTAEWAEKYSLTVTGSSGATAGTSIDLGTNAVYLVESQINALIYTSYIVPHVSTASAQDSNTKTNKYFAGWTYGTTAITSETDFAELFSESNKSITVNGVWNDKVTIKITPSSSGSPNKTGRTIKIGDTVITDTTFYVMQGTNISITANCTGKSSWGSYAKCSVTIKAGSTELAKATADKTYLVSNNAEASTTYKVEAPSGEITISIAYNGNA